MSWLQPSDFERGVCDDVGQRWPEILPLARLVSLALRVEPLLLRNARLRFLDQSATELESLLWFSPLIAARSSREVVLHSGVARLLADALRGEDTALFDMAWACTRDHTAHWSAEDRLEQDLRYRALLGDRGALAGGLRDMLRRIHLSEDEGTRVNLARWVRRTLPAVAGGPDLEDTTRLLSQFVGQALGVGVASAEIDPPTALPDWLATRLPGPYKPARLGVELRYDPEGGRQVLHCIEPPSDGPAVEFPTALPAELHVQCENHRGARHRVATGTRIALPLRARRVRLTTLDGRRYELLGEPPPESDTPKAEVAPEIYLTHVATDAGQARRIADWLAGFGISVRLLEEDEAARLGSGEGAAGAASVRLLRLWTRAAQRYWLDRGMLDLPAGATSALLRSEPVDTPASGSGVEQLLDILGWDQPGAGHAERLLGAVKAWLDRGVALPTSERAAQTTVPDVFISYCREDLAAAQKLHHELEEIGAGVAWFDKSDLKLGDWEAEILRAVQQCSLFLPLISAQTEAREEGYFRKEWYEAAERLGRIMGRRFVFPVVIDPDFDGDPSRYKWVNARFAEIHWGHAPGGAMSDALRTALVTALRALRGEKTEVLDSSAAPTIPTADAGPSDEVRRLLTELENPQTTPPRRLEIGDRLAELGDPREGVGVRESEIEEPLATTDTSRQASQALLQELQNAATKPPRRLEIGDQLAKLGDPREGVGLDSSGLPDLAWLAIPGGAFVYQGNKATISAFRMARYPVTNIQYQAFMDAGGYEDQRWWTDLETARPEASRWPQPNRPRTNVNWYEAVAFCRWLSAQLGDEVRLPTEQEWERAAAGIDGRAYPWSKDYQEGYANVDEKKTQSSRWFLEQTTAVGMYPQGRSQEGVLDLAGNVWEWCLSKYDKPELTGVDASGDDRVLRGGSWGNSPDYARAGNRNRYHPEVRFFNFGFRVVSSAPIA